MPISEGVDYTFWIFGGTVPGSFIRVRRALAVPPAPGTAPEISPFGGFMGRSTCVLADLGRQAQHAVPKGNPPRPRLPASDHLQFGGRPALLLISPHPRAEAHGLAPDRWIAVGRLAGPVLAGIGTGRIQPAASGLDATCWRPHTGAAANAKTPAIGGI